MPKLDPKKFDNAVEDADLPDAHEMEFDEKLRALRRRQFEHDRLYKTVREIVKDDQEG